MVRVPKTVSQIDVSATWISYIFVCPSAIWQNTLLNSCNFGVRKTHVHDAIISTVRLLVSVKSSISHCEIAKTKHHFGVSLILTPTIFPTWHFCVLPTVVQILIFGVIWLHTRCRSVLKRLWILRFWIFESLTNNRSVLTGYRFGHSAMWAPSLGVDLWSHGCWFVTTVPQILTSGVYLCLHDFRNWFYSLS